MNKFINAEQALSLSKKNKQKQMEYYLDNIERDRKANTIKREIEKAIIRGDDYAYVVFLTSMNDERATAIEKYFSNLGYDIYIRGNRCRIKMYNRTNFPKPPKIYR